MPLNLITKIMKKIKLLSVIMVLFAAAGLISCETEQLDNDLLTGQPNGGNNNNGPASFRVDFSNQTYVASTAQAQVQGTTMAIIGLRGTSGESVALTIPGGIAAGTYNAATMMYVPSATATAFYSNTNVQTGVSNGSVTITSINTTAKTVSGTFSFTGHYSNPTENLPTVAFTNGSFTNVPYTGTIPGGGGPGTDPGPQVESYKATIGGEAVDFGTTLTNDSMGMLQLMGTEGSRTVQLVVNSNITPGTYSLGAGIPSAMVTIGTDMYMATSGSIVIQSNTGGWIKGTFEFQAANPTNPTGTPINVTAGSFNLEY